MEKKYIYKDGKLIAKIDTDEKSLRSFMTKHNKKIALTLAFIVGISTASFVACNQVTDDNEPTKEQTEVINKEFNINSQDLKEWEAYMAPIIKSARENGIGEKFTAEQWINFVTVANIDQIRPGYLGYSDALTSAKIIDDYLEVLSNVYMDMFTVTKDTKFDIDLAFINEDDADIIDRAYGYAVDNYNAKTDEDKKATAYLFNQLVDEDIIQNGENNVSYSARLVLYRIIAFMEQNGVKISDGASQILYDAESIDGKVCEDTDFYTIARTYLDSALADKINIIRTDKDYDSARQQEKYEELVAMVEGLIKKYKFNANPTIEEAAKDNGNAKAFTRPSNDELENPLTPNDKIVTDPNTGEQFVDSGKVQKYDPAKDKNIQDFNKKEEEKWANAEALFDQGFADGEKGVSPKSNDSSYMQGYNLGYANYLTAEQAKQANQNTQGTFEPVEDNSKAAPTEQAPKTEPAPEPTPAPTPTPAAPEIRDEATPGDELVSEEFVPVEGTALTSNEQLIALINLRNAIYEVYYADNSVAPVEDDIVKTL